MSQKDRDNVDYNKQEQVMLVVMVMMVMKVIMVMMHGDDDDDSGDGAHTSSNVTMMLTPGCHSLCCPIIMILKGRGASQNVSDSHSGGHQH